MGERGGGRGQTLYLPTGIILNKLQLNNDKTEMILIAPKKVLSSVSVLQSIKLDCCNVKLANTARNLGDYLGLTLSFKQQISL